MAVAKFWLLGNNRVFGNGGSLRFLGLADSWRHYALFEKC